MTLTMSHRLLGTCAILLCALISTQARAVGPVLVQVRSGMLLGSLSAGETTGSISTLPYLDVECNIMTSSQNGYSLRAVLAPDLEELDLNYAYAGVGQRYYLGGPGVFISRTEEGASVSVRPGINYFVGWDFGMSHSILSRVGSLAAASTAFDFGLTAGANWYVSDGVAIQFGASTSYALGFTTLAASGIVIKSFIGISF